MTMTFLKIPMMVKNPEDCRDTLDKWLYLLKNLDKMEAIPAGFLNDPVFRKLGSVARIAALDQEKRRDYERSLKAYRDSYAIFTTERQEGFEEGRAEGRAEGIAEGRAEGRAEGEINLIRKMYSNGMTLSGITSITGYSLSELKKIIKK